MQDGQRGHGQPAFTLNRGPIESVDEKNVGIEAAHDLGWRDAQPEIHGRPLCVHDRVAVRALGELGDQLPIVRAVEEGLRTCTTQRGAGKKGQLEVRAEG